MINKKSANFASEQNTFNQKPLTFEPETVKQSQAKTRNRQTHTENH
jgi:hypothetical protein